MVGTVLELDPTWRDAFATTRSRIPTSNPFSTTATRSGDELVLQIATGDATRLNDVIFFPADSNLIDDGAPQSVAANSEGLVLTLRRDKLGAPPVLNGVLAFRDETSGVSGALLISTPIGSVAPHFHAGTGLIAALLLAIAGGIVLNLMPCVLPVLSIKVLALVQHSQSPRQMQLQGIAYAAGILASFAIIGGALIGLRSAGAAIGWGFQLQSPIFVTLMIYLLFAVRLNLSGFFSVSSRLTGSEVILPRAMAMRDPSSPARLRPSSPPRAPRRSWQRLSVMQLRNRGTSRLQFLKRSDWDWRCPIWSSRSVPAREACFQSRVFGCSG